MLARRASGGRSCREPEGRRGEGRGGEGRGGEGRGGEGRGGEGRGKWEERRELFGLIVLALLLAILPPLLP